MEVIFEDKSKKQLVMFLRKHLGQLGPSASSNDKHRLMILFFGLSGLDLLNCLDQVSESQKSQIIDWIYLQQLEPEEKDFEKSIQNGKFGFSSTTRNGVDTEHEFCNLAMTYCALASLVILGDDLSRINRLAIQRGLQTYQMSDGNFILALNEKEDDLRVTYCAATICFMLNDWSTVDKKRMISFIKSCLNYENAFGQRPGTEAHGGPTFCALASLHLMKEFDNSICSKQIEDIALWCLKRQVSGFQGRPYKDPDTCYSFWVGASLWLLDFFKFVNMEQNLEFLLSAKHPLFGGFGKYPDVSPDILHTFFSISALSIISEANGDNFLQSVYPSLNISQRAFKHLSSLHQSWSKQ